MKHSIKTEMFKPGDIVVRNYSDDIGEIISIYDEHTVSVKYSRHRMPQLESKSFIRLPNDCSVQSQMCVE